jgi:hypothetical protein
MNGNLTLIMLYAAQKIHCNTVGYTQDSTSNVMLSK